MWLAVNTHDPITVLLLWEFQPTGSNSNVAYQWTKAVQPNFMDEERPEYEADDMACVDIHQDDELPTEKADSKYQGDGTCSYVIHTHVWLL